MSLVRVRKTRHPFGHAFPWSWRCRNCRYGYNLRTWEHAMEGGVAHAKIFHTNNLEPTSRWGV